jgi:protein CpxP
MKARYLSIPALAVCALLAGNAFADARGPQDFNPEQIFARLEKLHDDLNLNAAQDQLWQRAAAKTRESVTKMHEQGRGLHERARAELDKPTPDLRALSTDMERFHEQRHAAHVALKQEWLAVYDSLNPEQQQKVAQRLKQRMERMEHWHHGGHHPNGGNGSDAPGDVSG